MWVIMAGQWLCVGDGIPLSHVSRPDSASDVGCLVGRVKRECRRVAVRSAMQKPGCWLGPDCLSRERSRRQRHAQGWQRPQVAAAPAP